MLVQIELQKHLIDNIESVPQCDITSLQVMGPELVVNRNRTFGCPLDLERL